MELSVLVNELSVLNEEIGRLEDLIDKVKSKRKKITEDAKKIMKEKHVEKCIVHYNNAHYLVCAYADPTIGLEIELIKDV